MLDVIDTAAITAVVLGLTQALKQMIKNPELQDRFTPVLALILGVISGVLYLDTANLAVGVFKGLAAGLAAIGLYSGGVKGLGLKS